MFSKVTSFHIGDVNLLKKIPHDPEALRRAKNDIRKEQRQLHEEKKDRFPFIAGVSPKFLKVVKKLQDQDCDCPPSLCVCVPKKKPADTKQEIARYVEKYCVGY